MRMHKKVEGLKMYTGDKLTKRKVEKVYQYQKNFTLIQINITRRYIV